MNIDFLSEESRELLKKLRLSIDEVVSLIRHKYYFDDDFDAFCSPSFRRLGEEIESELRRLNMIRDDFYSSERLILSANIFALREMVREQSIKGLSYIRSLSYYYDSKDYVNRLLRDLDDDKYESWQGYDDDTVTRVKELLEKTLTSTEYDVICMRFGLNDGRCRKWQEIAQNFGWKSKGGPAYHEKNAIRKLYGVIDELGKLTKL